MKQERQEVRQIDRLAKWIWSGKAKGTNITQTIRSKHLSQFIDEHLVHL